MTVLYLFLSKIFKHCCDCTKNYKSIFCLVTILKQSYLPFNLNKSLFLHILTKFYTFVYEQGIVTTLNKKNSELYTPCGV